MEIIQNNQLTQQAVDFIKEIETQKKALEEKYADFKTKLLQAMEESGTVKLTTDDVTISYIGKGEREKFDTTAFKKEFADLYDKYCTFIEVKPSIRIKLK